MGLISPFYKMVTDVNVLIFERSKKSNHTPGSILE